MECTYTRFLNHFGEQYFLCCCVVQEKGDCGPNNGSNINSSDVEDDEQEEPSPTVTSVMFAFHLEPMFL